MINPISTALRLSGFDKPTVWSIMTPLAVKTQSVNLGQGFPSWQPPDFHLKNLENSLKTSSHQYCRAFGSLNYTKAIAEFHKKSYGEVNHEQNICVVNGGVEGLYCSIMGFMNPGDQAILFDPSYDCYRPQIQMAGGFSIGIPLVPRVNQSKADVSKKMQNGGVSDENDEWDINFQAFEKALNPKTKVIILNSPHNPTGKVFTNEELAKIAKILQKHPQVIVIEDSVYQGITFDNMAEKELPKIAFHQGMFDRTVGIYSAGKIFASTGIRSGWVIGPAPLIKAVRSVHQYNVFCQYNVLQNTVAHSLQEISQPNNTYLKQVAQKMTKHRNLLLKQLIKSPFDFNLWIPKGGYFVLADISKVPIMQKYLFDDNGQKRTKDYAFAYQLAFQNKVVCIPISPFYGSQDSHLGQKYVRFAFCKDEEMILQASKRFHK